jgi:hypothetical protein
MRSTTTTAAADVTDEPNRDREQPVEAHRDAALGTEPMGGALLPVGGPGNDPDADKLGDEDAEVDSRAPADEDGSVAVDRETYVGEPERHYTDDVRD